MTDFFSTPDDLGEIRQSELHASLGERLGAQALDAIDPQDSLSGMYIARRLREENAGGGNIGVPGAAGELDVFSGQPLEERQAASDAFRAAVPDTAIADARARIKQEGLEGHLKLPDQPSVKSPVLDLMIQEAHERRDRELAIARGPQGFIPGALGLVTSLGAGMVDPVNMAAFSIPVLSEARMGRLMASAGDSILARTGARTLQGGAQGAVGTAVLQPADWWLHTQDGQDYSFADALKSVVMGAGMGAGFHAGFGAIGDLRARMRGAPLAGSPEDLAARAIAPAAGAEVAPAELQPASPPAAPLPPDHPANMLADLPPAAQEDVVRAAVADIAADRPVRGAEILQIAADHDPRIAESLDLQNLSPVAARDAVFADIHHQLISAGMTEGEAASNAAIVAARYATRAERLAGAGGNALDLYRGEGIDIRRSEFAGTEPGRVFNQPAIVDGIRVDFPDADHIALFDLGHRLAKGEAVDDAEAARLFKRFKGFVPEMDAPLEGTADLRDAAREYYEGIDEEVRKGRPFDAWSIIDPDMQHDWFRRALNEATAGEPVPTLRGQMKLFQSGRRKAGPDLFAGREAEGQTSLPGTERIGQGELAQRKANEPLKAGVAQKPMDVGLFGDDAAQKSLFQHGEADSPRGRITLTESRAIIDLFKDADRSTFMHESGHLWLDELMRDAEHPHAGEQLRADRETVLRWLGVKDASEIGTTEHEKWAEGFEHYLASGEAPSGALARAFEAFKQWLGEIYRALAGAGHDISPEIRGVMDRLLASDQEIAARRAEKAAARPGGVRSPAPAVAAKPRRGRAAADPQSWSLFEYLASRGGLKPTADLLATFGNKRGPFVPGFGPLLRKGGMSMDDALVAAKEGGYFLDPTSQEHVQMVNADRAALDQAPTFGLRDLEEKIDQESRGAKQYRAGHIEATKYDPEQEKHVIMGALETELEKAGEDVSAIDPKLLDRTVEIVHREGVSDVMDAYERAIMEDEERYNAIADARQSDPRVADIPGFDGNFDDGRAAPGDGRRDQAGGGQAGRSEQGRGRADDSQPSSHGARAAAAAADPRWRELADVTPAEEDPDVLAQSREADRLPEPDSLSPEKSLTALEKQAVEAEAIWRKLEPTLSENERGIVNDVLDQLKLDKEARDRIITDGAACLVGAMA